MNDVEIIATRGGVSERLETATNRLVRFRERDSSVSLIKEIRRSVFRRLKSFLSDWPLSNASRTSSVLLGARSSERDSCMLIENWKALCALFKRDCIEDKNGSTI